MTTVLCSGLAAPAFAQSVSPHPNPDANGIDLTTGTFNIQIPIASVGSGDAELPLIAYSGQIDNWTNITFTKTNGPIGTGFIYSITLGLKSDRFNGTGAELTSTVGSGAVLGAGTDTATYQMLDGTIIEFSNLTDESGGTSNQCDATNTSNCILLPTTIRPKGGAPVHLDWLVHGNCTNVPIGEPRDCTFSSRLAGVSNDAGYAISFSYASDTVPLHQNPGPTWFQRTSASLSGGGTVTYGGSLASTSTITTPGGRTWQITGTSVRRPGATGDTLTVSHPGSGLTTVVRDGVTTNYNYSVSGTTATMVVTDALSHSATIISDLNIRRPTQVTDANGKITTYSYDTLGQPTEITYPEGNKVHYTYDGRGNVTETRLIAKPGSGLADIVTSAGYNASCDFASFSLSCNSPNWTKDAKGNQTDYTYDGATGLVTTVTLPAPSSGANRPQTRYSYTNNAAGVPLLTGVSTCQTGVAPACVGTADEVKSVIAYDSALNATSVSKGAGDGSLTTTTTTTYSATGDVLTVDGPLSGTADTVTYRYDADRLRLGVIAPDPDGAGALKRQAQKTTYNNAGQPSVTELGTVNGTSDTDWAAFVSTQQVTSTYDANARKTRDVVTAGGTIYGVSEYSYDSLGRSDCTATRMNSSLWGTPFSACTAATAGTDGPDRIAKVTLYDALNRPKEVTTAYGTTDASVEKTGYTDNGQTASLTDAENNKTSYLYDGFDRLSVTSYPSPTKGSGTSSGTDFEQLTYDANGNITSRRLRDATTIGYAYDNLNRLTTKDLPGSELDVSYTYDLPGRLKSAATTAQTVSLGWDALGRQVSETGPLGTMGYQYDVAGNRTAIVWPDSNVTTYTYDVTNAMSGIYQGAGTSTWRVQYSYDDLGRRSSISRVNGPSTTYGYDPMSRLSSLVQNLGGASHDLSIGLSYNPAGQIASRTASNDLYSWSPGNTDRPYVANGLNQYSSAGGTSFTYDARGNLTSSGSATYGYSSENQLISMSGGVTLSYDPLGRFYQLSSSSATNRFQYIGDQIAAEYDGSNNRLRRYVPGAGRDEPALWYEGSGITGTGYFHADERGSVVTVSDSTSNGTSANAYDEYGIPAPTNSGRFQYTGQAYFPVIGMYYYKARMYSPTLGRFMQTDPIGYWNGFNWYNYINSDPINATDPSGTICVPVDLPGYQTTNAAGDIVNVNVVGKACGRAPASGGGGSGGFMGLGGFSPGLGTPQTRCYATAPNSAFLAPGATIAGEAAAGNVAAGTAVAVALALLVSRDTPAPQYVIRGGIVTPESLINKTQTFDYNGTGTILNGFSATSAPGMTVEQLAGVARYRNGQIGYTTVQQLQRVGASVVETPFLPQQPLHVTVAVPSPLSPAQAAAISAQFTTIPNPTKGC
jgi:RHS repeat-associated protein